MATEHTILGTQGHLCTTTDATQTAAVHVATRTNEAYLVTVKCIAVDVTTSADYSQIAGYVRYAAFKNDAGTLALVGSVATTATIESAGGWDLTLDASGTDIRVLVTGEAAKTVKWRINVEVLVQGAHTPIA